MDLKFVLHDYENFNTSDFVVDDAFIRHHLFPTRKSQHYWDAWLVRHPLKKKEWYRAKELIEAVQLGLNDYTRTYLSEKDEEILLKRILTTNTQEITPSAQLVYVWKNPWVRSVAAASLLLTCLVIGYMYLTRRTVSAYNQHNTVLFSSAIEKTNATSAVDTVELPDHSVVLLYPQSHLSYSNDFGKINRTVNISGKAVFDVVRDPDKPFIVYANELVTKVLGTRFEVQAYDDSREVVVKVISGQVSIFKNKNLLGAPAPSTDQRAMLLMPNQQLTFSRQTEEFNKKLVEVPLLVLPPKTPPPSFDYEETEVASVFADLETAYGVDIIYNKSLLEGCQLTASLSNETYQEKLNIICKSIGATYEIIDAHIIISSNGCTF
ncbi:FecR family protein [Telluribacter sp.]|jgi:ferric-dicitrate binding protein FerR (iron transport regulator)|uniref:FecR family protein n=1 Tax=Telluribacter sp. TaxID=1978767 RepID=UPI002E1521E9|nr:FecR family protein [Telluribacter sp.]